MNSKRLFLEAQNQFRKITSLSLIQKEAARSKDKPLNIHLFTHPRGGSTALAEAISKNVNSPIVWEPFFKGRKPFKRHDHRRIWGWKEYIDPDAKVSTIDDFFRDISNRTHLHPRFFTGQSIAGLHHHNPLVYKYCHANFLAPYLIRRFNLKAILLDRHVCQIIASRKKYGGFFKGKRAYPIDSAQTKNHAEIFHLHESKRNETIRSSAGEHAWNYCLIRTLQNTIPSEQVLKIDFEQIIIAPDDIAARINSFYGTTLNGASFSERSKTSVEFTPNKSEYLSKWKSRLSTEEIGEIQEIVHDVFGFYDIPFD